MITIWSTVHTTTQHKLLQLIFGRDEIPNINQEVNYQLIEHHEQDLINQDNQKKNIKF